MNILTILAKKWSWRKIMDTFRCSQRMVTQAKHLATEKGYFPNPSLNLVKVLRWASTERCRIMILVRHIPKSVLDPSILMSNFNLTDTFILRYVFNVLILCTLKSHAGNMLSIFATIKIIITLNMFLS